MVNLRTLELLIGLIHSYAQTSKGPTCPDIENEDLSTSSTTLQIRNLQSLCLDMYIPSMSRGFGDVCQRLPEIFFQQVSECSACTVKGLYALTNLLFLGFLHCSLYPLALNT